MKKILKWYLIGAAVWAVVRYLYLSKSGNQTNRDFYFPDVIYWPVSGVKMLLHWGDGTTGGL